MNSPLTEEEAACIAKHVAEGIVKRLSDEETVAQITEVWGRHLDLMVGRGVRKIAWFVFLSILVVAAVKFNAFVALLKP